jgi:hypothetical protein
LFGVVTVVPADAPFVMNLPFIASTIASS